MNKSKALEKQSVQGRRDLFRKSNSLLFLTNALQQWLNSS